LFFIGSTILKSLRKAETVSKLVIEAKSSRKKWAVLDAELNETGDLMRA
jgi:hypothetical protein